jgi:hypothetical protein
MSDPWDGLKTVVDFPLSDMGTWVVLRDTFPSGRYETPEPWARAAAGGIYVGFLGTSADVPEPDPDWIERMARIILSARKNFTGGTFRHSLLMFYAIDSPPIPVGITVYAAELPWQEAVPLFAGARDPELVGEPVIEDFTFPAGAVGVRSIRYGHLDPERRTVLARVVYYFRRNGLDCQVIATFVDPSALKPALGKLDAFAGKLAVYAG